MNYAADKYKQSRMEKVMNSKQILAAVTLSSIAMVSQSALAMSIDVTYLGSSNFGSGSVGY